MKLTRTPYANQLARHQAPKPRGGDNLDHGARPGQAMCTCKSSAYEWNQCFYVGASIPRSGEADSRKAWRCPDCGAEGDVERDACCRCGSVAPLEYR